RGPDPCSTGGFIATPSRAAKAWISLSGQPSEESSLETGHLKSVKSGHLKSALTAVSTDAICPQNTDLRCPPDQAGASFYAGYAWRLR
ncbi:hypothetical protein, partial [Dissulfurirhabdus thermomarina]|uniref:hypothetical protein n=1 Tax=Dissulfurirhabdus thermomarina TaxID=1765737 RepID=UPI001C65AC46